ncbi:hypothetical protein QBC35DRAFT_497175 [Podospora australis]|uniref:Uncharacterized protein n=1 Tax=Podospora australis TaxID=1536484 RepID=A0AAN6WU33_9PEZI|nr:hypothetical protein QBC35DRAFT_497175 [Podospora australis]
MKHFTAILPLFAFLATVRAQEGGITSAPPLPSVSGCPAVLSITMVCNTCVTLECITIASITVGCPGDPCGATPATIRTGYPCDNGCSGLGGCRTSYRVVSAQGDMCGTPTGSVPTSTTVVSTTSTSTVTTGSPSSASSLLSETTDAPSTTESVPTSETLASTESVSTNGAGGRLSPFRFW